MPHSKETQPELPTPVEQVSSVRESAPVPVDDLSLLLRLRQLGDNGLRQAMQVLSKDE